MKYGDPIEFFIVQFGEKVFFSGVFLAYGGDRLDVYVEAPEYGRAWVPINQLLTS